MYLFLGGIAAAMPYAGMAPSYARLYQFNVKVPMKPDNDAMPLTFSLGGVAGTQTLHIATHQ